MQTSVEYIYIWGTVYVSFKTQEARIQLFKFMDDEEIYLKLVEDHGDIINMNQILINEDVASNLFNKMRPQLKDAFIHYIKNV